MNSLMLLLVKTRIDLQVKIKGKRRITFKLLLSLGFHIGHINLFQLNYKATISMKTHLDVVNRHFALKDIQVSHKCMCNAILKILKSC